MKTISRLLLGFLVVFGLDAATKIWAEQALEPYQPVQVIGDLFRFTLGYNTGVAFGLFANGGMWPLMVTGIIIVIITVWFTRGLFSEQFSPYAAWPVGMLLGGAIGNFIDRLFDGRVTDFIDVGIGSARWPTFNLADSFILIGVAILMLLSFKDEAAQQGESISPIPAEGEAGNISSQGTQGSINRSCSQ